MLLTPAGAAPDTVSMRRLQQVVEAFLVFLAFPLACLVLVSIVLALGAKAVAIYVGALLAAWLVCAFMLPMLFGAMTPDEVVANIRSRRVRRTALGEPLPADPVQIEAQPLLEPRLEAERLSEAY